MKIAILSDGASHNNGGICGIGAVMIDQDTKQELDCLSESIGNGTNTLAEYTAIEKGAIMAKSWIEKTGAQVEEIVFLADSNLVVSQLNGEWKTSADVKPLALKAKIAVSELSKYCSDIKIDHIPREYNTRADELSTQAVEKALSEHIENKYPFLK